MAGSIRKSWLGRSAAVVAALAVASGCTGGSGAEPQATATPTGSAAPQSGEASAAPALQPVKLKYYYRNPIAAVGQGLKEVNEKVNEITKAKINAEVELIPIDGPEYDQKMNVLLASGEAFDLMFTAPWANSYEQNVARGGLIPLDELLPKYAPNTWKQFRPEIWNAARINGKIYASINQQISARQTVVALRKEFVELTKFDPKTIQTYKDLGKYYEAIAAAGVKPEQYSFRGDVIHFDAAVMQPLNWEGIGGNNVPGAVVADAAQPKVFNQFDTPEFKEYVTTLSGWKEPYFKINEKGDVPKTQFAMRIAPVYKFGQNESEEKWGGTVESVIQPFGKYSVNTAGTIATMTGVSSTSKNPERAVMFIELLNTDKELYNLMCYGIEGRDHKKVGPDRIETLPERKYWPNSDWMFGNQFNAYKQPSMPDDIWEQQKKFNDSATISTLMGFSFDSKPVATEIANTNAVMSQYLNAFGFGMLGPERLPEFIDKLNKAGADKIIAEKQKQIDAFMSAKK